MHAKALLLGTLLATSCLQPLEAPSRYESVEVACDDEARWAELVEACRADYERDESCAGVLHFEGSLEGIDVRFGSFMVESEFEEDIYVPSGRRERDGFSARGQGPFFEVSMSYAGVGGEIGPDVDLPALATVPNVHNDFDLLVDGTLRMSNGFQSEDLRVAGGMLVRTVQSDLEQAGRFSTAYGDEDQVIDGCFHFFATAIELQEKPDPPDADQRPLQLTPTPVGDGDDPAEGAATR